MSIENGASPKSTKVVTVVVAIVVIIIIALFVFLSPSSQAPTNNTAPTANTSGITASTTGGPTGSAFSEVKGVGKIYQIQVEKGAVNPVTTTVVKGDVAHLSFSAIDTDIEISFAAPIDMNITLKKGQAALVPFDAQKNNTGEYAFSVKSADGKTLSGKIIIK